MPIFFWSRDPYVRVKIIIHRPWDRTRAYLGHKINTEFGLVQVAGKTQESQASNNVNEINKSGRYEADKIRAKCLRKSEEILYGVRGRPVGTSPDGFEL